MSISPRLTVPSISLVGAIHESPAYRILDSLVGAIHESPAYRTLDSLVGAIHESPTYRTLDSPVGADEALALPLGELSRDQRD